jgi:hypothetical protein
VLTAGSGAAWGDQGGLGEELGISCCVRQRCRVERQRGPVEPDALLECQPSHGLGGGSDRPGAGGCGLPVGRQLGPVPGKIPKMVRQVTGELRLDRLRDGAVQGQPVGSGERRLYSVPGQRVSEPVAAVFTDSLE